MVYIIKYSCKFYLKKSINKWVKLWCISKIEKRKQIIDNIMYVNVNISKYATSTYYNWEYQLKCRSNISPTILSTF
jgi:hypothetical protein